MYCTYPTDVGTTTQKPLAGCFFFFFSDALITTIQYRSDVNLTNRVYISPGDRERLRKRSSRVAIPVLAPLITTVEAHVTSLTARNEHIVRISPHKARRLDQYHWVKLDERMLRVRERYSQPQPRYRAVEGLLSRLKYALAGRLTNLRAARLHQMVYGIRSESTSSVDNSW